MCGSRIGLQFCNFLQDFYGFLTAAKFRLEHTEYAKGAKVVRRDAQCKAGLLLSLGIFAFRRQNQTQIQVGLGIVWPFAKGVTKQFSGFRVFSCPGVRDSEVVLSLREL